MYNIWVFLFVSLWNFMHFALQLVCFAAVLLYMNKTLHLGFFSVVFCVIAGATLSGAWWLENARERRRRAEKNEKNSTRSK